MKSKSSSDKAFLSLPSTKGPALKSIQLGFLVAKLLLLETLMPGTAVPNGVPRPVVYTIKLQPEIAKAVVEIPSLPGLCNRLRPCTLT